MIRRPIVLVVAAALAAIVAGPPPASAAAVDIRVGERVEELYAVEVVAIRDGALLVRKFTDADRGDAGIRVVPWADVIRLKCREAETFTHAEWQRTEVANPRMAEDAYRQTLAEVADGRSAGWSRTAALLRLTELMIGQNRPADAVPFVERLGPALGDGIGRFLPAEIAADDAGQYDRAVKAVHARMAVRSADHEEAARPAADGEVFDAEGALRHRRSVEALTAFARRLAFRGPAVFASPGFLGLRDVPLRRVAVVVHPDLTADRGPVRRAVAGLVRSLGEGAEFAVWLGGRRCLLPQRRVGMSGVPVAAEGEGHPDRLNRIDADPRMVWDDLLPAPPTPGSGRRRFEDALTEARGQSTARRTGLVETLVLVLPAVSTAEEREALAGVLKAPRGPAPLAAFPPMSLDPAGSDRVGPSSPADRQSGELAVFVVRVPVEAAEPAGSSAVGGGDVADGDDAWWEGLCRSLGGRHHRVAAALLQGTVHLH